MRAVRPLVAVLVLLLVLTLGGGAWPASQALPPYTTLPPEGGVERVLTLGGSTMFGWGDAVDGHICASPNQTQTCGYIGRAFTALRSDTARAFRIVHREWVFRMNPGKYRRTVRAFRPRLVVLAYGIDDYLNGSLKRSQAVFEAQVRSQIVFALRAGAAVVVTTPPVTWYTVSRKYGTRERAYALGEMRVARSFKSAHVFVFDLMAQEEHELKVRHIDPYATFDHFRKGNLKGGLDPWHIDRAGHVLVGEILAGDMERAFQPLSPAGYLGDPPLRRGAVRQGAYARQTRP